MESNVRVSEEEEWDAAIGVHAVGAVVGSRGGADHRGWVAPKHLGLSVLHFICGEILIR